MNKKEFEKPEKKYQSKIESTRVQLHKVSNKELVEQLDVTMESTKVSQCTDLYIKVE